LGRQNKQVAEQKLWDLLRQNLDNTLNLVNKVAALPDRLRMVRLSSEVLPVYTHKDWSYFYKQADVQKVLEYGFAKIGTAARNANVRLSFHPGQFTVLASENPGIVNNSIDEFEYHADMVRMMGYGKTFQDFKINVHISGKLGPEGIRAAYKRLSPEARNCITIENEENAWGIDSSLELADLLPIVLDVHHHWCREGEWMDPRDDRVKRVVESWRGVRPVMHYSQSREDYLVGHATYAQPDMGALKDMGYKKQKLRAHSDFYWNTATNDWVLGFLQSHDIMCESKAKNLASYVLYERSLQINS
jgi:UV DNA damage repair endonuclease